MPKKKLSELLAEAAENAKNTISEQKWAELEKQANTPRNADSKRSVTCPHCGSDFDVSYKPSKETSSTENDDADNVGDRPNVAQNRPVDRLALLQRSMKEANRNK